MGGYTCVVVRLGFNLAAPTPAYLLCHMVEVENFIPNHFGKSSIIAFWRLERRRTGQRTFAATWLKRLSRFCWCSTIFVKLFNHISLSYVLSIDIADIVHFCTSRIMDYLSTRPAKLLTAYSLFSRWSNFRNLYFMSILKCWLSTLMSYLPELRPWMPSSRGSRLPRMWTQPCFCWWAWCQFFCCRFSFYWFLPRFSAECANFLSSAIHRVAAILMCWLFQIRFKGIFFNIFFFSIDPLFIFRVLRFRLSIYLHWQFCRKINQVYVIVHHITFTWHATCHIVFISNSMRCQPVLRSMWVQIVCGVESCLMWIICSDIVNISIWCCSRWIAIFTWGNSEPAMNCPCTLYKPFTTMWLCPIIYMWL